MNLEKLIYNNLDHYMSTIEQYSGVIKCCLCNEEIENVGWRLNNKYPKDFHHIKCSDIDLHYPVNEPKLMVKNMNLSDIKKYNNGVVEIYDNTIKFKIRCVDIGIIDFTDITEYELSLLFIDEPYRYIKFKDSCIICEKKINNRNIVFEVLIYKDGYILNLIDGDTIKHVDTKSFILKDETSNIQLGFKCGEVFNLEFIEEQKCIDIGMINIF